MNPPQVSAMLQSHSVKITRVYEIAGAPTVPMSPHNAQLYLPTRVVLTYTDGVMWAVVTGPKLLKDGTTGGPIHTIRTLTYCKPENRPEWLAKLVRETEHAAAQR